MERIRISTDSTADIPKSFCDELNIRVLPLSIITDEREYRDGVDIQPEDFYPIIRNAATLPTSSQVPAVLYTELYEQLWQEGCTDLIHVTLNGKGSGTYQAGMLTRELFYEDHPEARDTFRIHLLDSGTYSMAYGIPVIEAARMAKDGAATDAILAFLQEWLAHARPMFVPLDLQCVKKSGRVSAAAAFVGDALGLKPMITFENGESAILTKVRGENKAIDTLVATCLKERKPGSSYALVYGDNRDAYEKLKDACAKALDQPPLCDYPVGCIIGINTGPNMIGIIYRT